MQNKRLKTLSLALLMGGAFLLASCDSVRAKLPENAKSEAILANADKIYHNEMEDLFEKVVPEDSSMAEKVLNTLLEKLAQGKFGTFYGESGLRAAVADDAKLEAFVAAHSEMFASKDDAKDFYAMIVESLAKSFYGNVTNSSYQDRNYFVEKKFYQAQVEALYVLDEAYEDVVEAKVPVQVDGHKDYRDVEEYFGTVDHNYLDVYQDYIERALLPDAYRAALVTKYVVAKNYGALGRSYARKVQYIALKDVSESASAARDLAKAYAEFVLTSTKEEVAAKVKDLLGVDITVSDEDYETIMDLSFLDSLYTGTTVLSVPSAAIMQIAAAIYTRASYKVENVNIDGVPTNITPWTEVGKIIKDYSELSLDRNIDGSSTDFTGSGAYTRETGLMLKQREVLTKSNVQEGWYTRSDLSELPSEIKDRLFKIQVANEVDNNYKTEGEDVVIDLNQKMDYGWYRQGAYYLTKQDYKDTDAYPYVITSSNTTYIVRVEEAVKTSKLSTADNATNYKKLAELGVRGDDQETFSQIVLHVSSMLASTDSYKKAARQHFVEQANITYHDQAVYDYFKSTFPDLFD